MKKLLLILLCLPMIGFGQGWQQTYEGFGGATIQMGYSVQQTTDGGYIITGFSIDTTGSYIYLIKTDGNGIEQWSKTFGEVESYGLSVQQTTDGGYIITGQTYSIGNGSYDVYLIKTDGSGIEQWSKTFGGTSSDGGSSVQQTTDGGYIVTGENSNGVCLIKTDGNGIEQWNQTFGGYKGNSVQQTTDGGYIVTGQNSNDVCLIKTDGNGIEQWSKTFGGTSSDRGSSVQQTTDGGYIITGFTESFGNGGSDVYLIKTDGNGIEQWSKTFGGANWDSGNSVQQTTDGGYVITGRFEEIFEEPDVYLIKTDGNGIEQWSQNIGRTLGFGIDVSDEGFSVQQTTDGGYIITGFTIGFTSGYDVYLIKTDGNGNVTSTFNIPINPNRKLQKTVDILGKETKPKTNTPLIEIYDDGTVEKRIVIE